jgi:tetratricopeptide (TPR) repeat protein
MLVDLAKDFGHDALPWTRRVGEIQLRTILQEAWAEVEHEIIYKSEYTLLQEPIKRKLAMLNAILTLSDVTFQEVRDFLREVQHRDSRRKASLEEKTVYTEPISLLDEAEQTPTSSRNSGALIPVPHGTKIDRLVFQAFSAHSRGDFVKAIQLYSRALRMKSNRAIRSIIYNHRGMAYFVLSQYKRAVRDFSRAIHYDARSFRAYNNRALSYRILRQYERALQDLDRSLELNAFQAEGYYVRALTYFDLQDFSKALEDCGKVLNIKPDFVAVQHLKSLIASQVTGKP